MVCQYTCEQRNRQKMHLISVRRIWMNDSVILSRVLILNLQNSFSKKYVNVKLFNRKWQGRWKELTKMCHPQLACFSRHSRAVRLGSVYSSVPPFPSSSFSLYHFTLFIPIQPIHELSVVSTYKVLPGSYPSFPNKMTWTCGCTYTHTYIYFISISCIR